MSRSFFLNITFFFVVLATGTPGYGQDRFSEGNQFYSEGLYDEAITSYLRSIFLLKDSPQVSELYARVARCYVALGYPARALRYGNSAIASALSDTERREQRFSLVEILLAVGSYQSALNDLAALAAENLSSSDRLRWQFLHGVLSLYLYDWEQAFIHLSAYFAGTDTYPLTTEIKVLKLLSFARRSPGPDPRVARIFSSIIPGTGQMYAGDVLKGLNSLAVTAGLRALVTLMAVAGYWPEAAVIVYFAYLRFFIGSPYHGGRTAMEKRQHRAQAVLGRVLNWLTR